MSYTRLSTGESWTVRRYRRGWNVVAEADLDVQILSAVTRQEVIVYGQFYLPWSAVYWIMKKAA